VKLGAVFPQTEIGADRGGVRAYVEGVAGLGFDHMHCFDHVLGAHPEQHADLPGPYRLKDEFHEILVLFGFAAAIAPELELVTGVVIAPQRQTALLAKQAAELDILTGGRFRLGLGIGWNWVEYEALGMNFHDRGRRFEEQIELMRRLWTEPVFDFQGRWHTITAAGINPLPVQRPIPIWIGGSAEAALRRAACTADGLFPQRALEGGWPATLERMRAWREEAGGDWSTFGLDPRLGVGTDTPDDWRVAAEEWRGLGAEYLSLATTHGDLGSPDAHLARLEEARAVLADL